MIERDISTRMVVTLGLGFLLTISASLSAQPAATACGRDSWRQFVRALAAAQNAIQDGDAEPIKALWSHADDVTLMGALGGHERGWGLVGSRLSRIAGMNSKGFHDNDDVVTTVVGSDMALVVQVEHIANSGAGDGAGTVSHLRVTHVARCEGGAWRVIHRHADPLTESKLPAR